jgi:Zinc finger, ZZ type
MQVIEFNKIDSIETCTSHEKSESDESKRSELAKSEETYSNHGISECVGNSIKVADVGIQTDQIIYYNTSSGNDSMKSFSCQYDTALEFETRTLEETIKQEINQLAKALKIQCGVVHKDFKCNYCNANPIIGVRFECIACNYSICENCEQISLHPHELLKYKTLKPINQHLETKDAIIKKVVSMGLGDYSKVEAIAVQKEFNINEIVKALLF